MGGGRRRIREGNDGERGGGELPAAFEIQMAPYRGLPMWRGSRMRGLRDPVTICFSPRCSLTTPFVSLPLVSARRLLLPARRAGARGISKFRTGSSAKHSNLSSFSLSR